MGMDQEESTPLDWDELERELDAWRRIRRNATLWWRDDDAVSADPRLDRLLEISDGLPIALAVIPGLADESLARRMASEPYVTVLQHGWKHTNHAPEGERAAELGAHRPLDIILDELGRGRQLLSQVFGRLALPILVPPWNRVADCVASRLSQTHHCGLSTSGPRKSREASPRVVQVNVHIDMVDWRTRSFIGPAEAKRRLLEHLSARREGRADVDEPTGILTHHLCMNAESQTFLERFISFTCAHPAVRWQAAGEAFAVP
jgi:hypothetical protein